MIARRRGRENAVRVIGLSTALANAVDVADWLGVPDVSKRGESNCTIKAFVERPLQLSTQRSSRSYTSAYSGLPFNTGAA